MSVLGNVDAPLNLFGGLVTDMAAADLPAGVSPDCADVAFVSGAVQTRPGLAAAFAAIGGNPTINYLKTYIQPNLTQTMLALDSAGTLWGESASLSGSGVLSALAGGIVPGARAKSATFFGREYMAFHDGKFGVDLPRQYDGTWFDRVSQIGPQAGPVTVADAAPEPNKSIASIARASGVVTLTTTGNHNYLAGETVTVAGVSDA
jgi:hypothetical protein